LPTFSPAYWAISARVIYRLIRRQRLIPIGQPF
jgi:hypothetical protein